MHPLETYLRDLRTIHTQGVAETSGYGPLATLLNEIGATLKPRVRCIINTRNQGAGIPDGGLFTPDQLSRDDSPDTMPLNTLPSRGVLEVKGTRDEVLADPAWRDRMTDADWRGLTPLFFSMVMPYGDFVLDMTRRISLKTPVEAVG